MDWQDFLPGLQPRDDLQQDFAAESFEADQPALLTNHTVMTAALVAARVLEIVAHRGGTRIKPSALERLRRIIARALPEAAVNLCNDEAERVLRWLTKAEAYRGEEPPGRGESPEVDIMFDADIESRISVAQFALEEGFDLELEYLDDDRNIWPRVRCTPVELLTVEGDDGADEPALLLDCDFGELEIPIHHVRWLMPVSSRPQRRTKKKPGAKVLTFPTGDSD